MLDWKDGWGGGDAASSGYTGCGSGVAVRRRILGLPDVAPRWEFGAVMLGLQAVGEGGRCCSQVRLVVVTVAYKECQSVGCLVLVLGCGCWCVTFDKGCQPGAGAAEQSNEAIRVATLMLGVL